MATVERALKSRECRQCHARIPSGIKHFRVYFGRTRNVSWATYVNYCESCTPKMVGSMISLYEWEHGLKMQWQAIVTENQEFRFKQRKENPYE